jgi:hypothetical protein
VYSGHDHFNSTRLIRGMDARGPLMPTERYAQARKEFAGNRDAETAAARGERYGGDRRDVRAERAERGNTGGWMSGGPFIISFDHADVWVRPEGLIVYGDREQEEIDLPNLHGDGRWGRVNTFYESLTRDEPPPADGRWGRATLEVILGIIESGEQRREIFLERQTPTADAALAPAIAVA